MAWKVQPEIKENALRKALGVPQGKRVSDYLTVERVVEAYRNGGELLRRRIRLAVNMAKHNSKFWRAVGERLVIV